MKVYDHFLLVLQAFIFRILINKLFVSNNLKFTIMKTKLFIATCMLIAAFATGQNETFISPKNPDEVTVTPPSFTMTKYSTKVDNILNEYLMNKMTYPYCSKKSRYQGTEVVLFTVTAEGNVTDFKVINSVCHAIDDAIVNAIKSTNGMWKPGRNNNVPVSMTKEVSVAFYIDDLPNKSQPEMFTKWATTAFNKGSVALFEKSDPKKALRFYDEGVNYMPYDKNLLLLRGMCRYELGNQEGALEDWNRMASLGGINMEEYASLVKHMKGYNEVMAILNE